MTTKKLKIGIQGVAASFHDVAARTYFHNTPVELVECNSFRRLCQVLKDREADFCMMAIENSLAGSIMPNYLLLEQFQFRIIGELWLRIEMNLMALAGQSVNDLTVVQSHPMALFQCQEFLLKYPQMKVIEGSDTADSAKEIKEKNLKGHGAIASRLAAEVYGLELLEQGIESDKQNHTRFLVISRGNEHFENMKPNKSSLRFEISDRPGSLISILSSFIAHGINMSKLLSVPIMGRPYEYSFHVDLEWYDYTEYQKALSELKLKAIRMIEFGEYKKFERPE
jgi:prephenate dehydratase